MFTNFFFFFFCFNGGDNIIIYACDCSNEALEMANKMIEVSNVGSVSHHCHLFHYDFSTSGWPVILGNEIFCKTARSVLNS